MEHIYTLEELQNRIGYQFHETGLLRTAVTHSSYVKEHADSGESNERMEFLGDAFLDAVIGEELYVSLPDREEGFLSQMRSVLVCEDALAKEAVRLELGQFLRLGNGEERNGGRSRKSILADAMEAVIGAVYIDGGFESVKTMILDLFGDMVADVEIGKSVPVDYKTALQEKLQQNGRIDIRYRVIGETGPDHDKTFTVQLEINGQPETTGEGKSKKKAEQQAARKMMEKL